MKRIFVWGLGIKFSLLLDRVFKIDDVTGFIDNKRAGECYLNRMVYLPGEIADMEYDAIIVANNSTEEIYRQCRELNINLDKVIFLYKNYTFNLLNDTSKLEEELFGVKYSNYLKNKYHIVNSPTIDEASFDILEEYCDDKMFRDDYIRVRTMLIAANTIIKRKIPGEVAELGVFRGDFAKNINKAFPKKKLYLFDTFQSFNPSEAELEKTRDTCNDAYVDAFKDTDIQMVMDKMKYPDNIVVKQGLFPQSLNGLEESFAFVSIDVDLEQSTYDGLSYFYPRLSSGGYIFIHDYNYGYFDVVNRAVEKYEKDIGHILAKVPLCDYDGTVVVTKI